MRLDRVYSVALAACVSVASAQQIYFSPPVTQNKINEKHRNDDLTPTKAAALLSHVFGTSHYTTTSAANYADLKPAPSRDGQQLVIMIDCPSASSSSSAGDCAVPPSVQRASNGGLRLPNLPFASWASLVTLELHRMATEYGIDPSAIDGLDSLAESIKRVPGWIHWVTKELGDFIGWHDTVRDSRQREVDPSTVITDVNLLDDSAKQLVFDLQEITQLAESAPSSKDTGAAPSQVHVLHLKGLRELSKASFERGHEMLTQALEGLLAAVDPVQVTVLSLPPYRKPLLSKRTPFLDPFVSPQERYSRSKREVPMNHQYYNDVNSYKVRRQELASKAKEDPITKVVPHSYICFKDEKDVKNQTANCMGRGHAVQAISNYQKDGADCWVCQCDKGFGGQGCEKQDLSSSFTLIFLSSAGLILILIASVMLLFGSANEPLPSTLAAVSGAKM